MATGEIIPYKFWLQAGTGKRASLYGCKPLGEGWTVETKGFTIRWPDGTMGTGRVPFDTEAEAEAYLARVPKGFSGMRQD